ncbi:unnamed protein product [marine sediment metagenome]|uniref:Uncharacterized protein n=1 Tax=marine sediment metagenome TaxID=412755 RepID=X1C205_9ZZZZ
MNSEVKYIKIIYEADGINSDLDHRFKKMLAKELGFGLWDSDYKNNRRRLIFSLIL